MYYSSVIWTQFPQGKVPLGTRTSILAWKEKKCKEGLLSMGPAAVVEASQSPLGSCESEGQLLLKGHREEPSLFSCLFPTHLQQRQAIHVYPLSNESPLFPPCPHPPVANRKPCIRTRDQCRSLSGATDTGMVRGHSCAGRP